MYKQARNKFAEALREVVRKRKEEKERRREERHSNGDGGGGDRKSDVLQDLLEVKSGGLLEEAVVDLIVARLVAGYETTSTSTALAVESNFDRTVR